MVVCGQAIATPSKKNRRGVDPRGAEGFAGIFFGPFLRGRQECELHEMMQKLKLNMAMN